MFNLSCLWFRVWDRRAMSFVKSRSSCCSVSIHWNSILVELFFFFKLQSITSKNNKGDNGALPFLFQTYRLVFLSWRALYFIFLYDAPFKLMRFWRIFYDCNMCLSTEMKENVHNSYILKFPNNHFNSPKKNNSAPSGTWIQISTLVHLWPWLLNIRMSAANVTTPAFMPRRLPLIIAPQIESQPQMCQYQSSYTSSRFPLIIAPQR